MNKIVLRGNVFEGNKARKPGPAGDSTNILQDQYILRGGAIYIRCKEEKGLESKTIFEKNEEGKSNYFKNNYA